MLRKRIIPKILIRKTEHGYYSVLSRNFDRFITVGDPLSQFKIMDSNKADEISIVNLHREGASPVDEFSQLLSKIVGASSTPISAGGGIKTLADADTFMKTGIEKISIPIQVKASNLFLFEYVSNKYGKQAVQATLDYSESESMYSIRKSNLMVNIDELTVLVMRYLNAGAGEIVATNIEHDGSRAGLDFSLLNLVKNRISVPILISGGAHSAENFVDAFSKGADGVLSGTYMAKMDQSLLQLRSKIAISGINVRRIK
jgi:imidazole glycerol-phosphate synthase subunit HisF